MCACDGVEPTDALAQSRGGYHHQVNAIQQAAKASKNRNTGRKKPFRKVGKLRESTLQQKKKRKFVDKTSSNSSDNQLLCGQMINIISLTKTDNYARNYIHQNVWNSNYLNLSKVSVPILLTLIERPNKQTVQFLLVD